MGISVASGFTLKSQNPLDERLLYTDLAALKAVEDYNLYDGCLAYVKNEDKMYQFKSTNSADPDTGKWREYTVAAPVTKSIVIQEGGADYAVNDVLEFDGKFYDVATVSVLGAVESIKESAETAASTVAGTGAVLAEEEDIYGLTGTTWKKISATGKGNVHGIDELLDEDITVKGVEVGNLTDGTKIDKGTSFTDILKQMLLKRIAATYTAPKASLSGDVTTFEKGVSTVVALTAAFTQNDAGAETSIEITDGLSTATGGTASYTIYSTKEFTTTISYGEGDVKNDNMGDPSPTGHIEAGNVTATFKVTGLDPIYTGTGAFDPDTNKGTKHLVAKPAKETTYKFTTVNDTCFIASPYEISQVLDQNSFDVTNTFTKTAVTYTRADSTTVTYNVYTNNAATLTDFGFKVTFA